MLDAHSQLRTRAAALRLFAAMAFVVFAGCAATPPQSAAAGQEAQDESDADAAGEAQAPASEPVDRSALPNQELTENLLYEFLLAEIAVQRGNAALSAQAYVDLAKRTRDPRIAQRATEVAALYARMNNAAIDAATIWHETEPGSTRALETLAGLLVAAGRYDEALPNLRKLLAGVPESSDAAFAVALLSLQLKDYDAAEKYLRSLIESPYRDKDGVRLYLGQVAEERKNLPEALRWYGEVGEGEQYVQAQIRYGQVLAT